MLGQLVVLLLLAVVIVAVSIRYKVGEIREEAAAWDALLARTRKGGAS